MKMRLLAVGISVSFLLSLTCAAQEGTFMSTGSMTME